MRIWKYTVLWYLGGFLYFCLEILWRGWSHGSMFVLGGLCFLLIGLLGQQKKPLPPVLRTLAGAGIITLGELAAGLTVNRDYAIWDYRGLPGNFMGHICLTYCLLWIPVSLGAIVLYDLLTVLLFRKSLAD